MSKLDNARVQQYRDGVRDRIREILEAPPFSLNGDLTERFIAERAQLGKNESYRKIISALDMFFYKFDSNAYAPCRVSTMVSRNRGCVIITGMSYLMKITQLGSDEILSYVMDSVLETEIMNSMQDGQELHLPNSYTFYLTEMSISKRSPYSASSCPGIHLWIHTLGCVLGYERSRNAGYVEAPTTTNIIRAASITALMFEKLLAQNVKFVATEDIRLEILGNERNLEERLRQEGGANIAMLGGGKPRDLQNILAGDEMPPAIGHRILQKLNHCMESRPNTVGRFLFQNLFPVAAQQALLVR